MKTEPLSTVARALRRQLFVSAFAGVILVCGIGGWAATNELAGAVVTQGLMVVETNVKKVQHPTGGVVGELGVREGDQVEAGQIVIRLDETVTRSNLQIVLKSLDEFNARRARLEAERDGDPRADFPTDLLNRMQGDPDVARVVNGEKRLFEIRTEATLGQKAQLRERVAQLKEQIAGIEKQIESKGREIKFIHTELEGVRELWKKNLLPITRLTALERDGARLEGESGALLAAVAENKGKIAETELQILQVDQTSAATSARSSPTSVLS